MDYLLKKKDISLSDDCKIRLVKTKKYKDINIYFSFTSFFSVLEFSYLYVLKDLVGQVSNNWPTKKEMIKKKNLLYAASVNGQASSLEYNQCFLFHYNFVDPAYLNDLKIDEYIDFIKDTLFNPLINENTFNEAKKLTKEAILRRLDDPYYYARAKMNDVLCQEDDRFKYCRMSIVENIDKLNLVEAKKVYQKLLNEAAVEIIIIGDIDDEFLTGIKNLPFINRKANLKHLETIDLNDLKIKEETKKTNQTALIAIYQVPEKDLNIGKNYATWFVLRSLLGGLPSSLLFQEIREKLSLCYMIDVNDNRQEGMLYVQTLISKENIDEVTKQIDIQIKRIEDDDYSDEQFNTCKKLIKDSLIQSTDEATMIYNYYHNRCYYTDESFEEMIRSIEEVKRSDVQELIKGYHHVLTYVLKSL